MEQSRVEDLERLLTDAIAKVVIRDSKNERISLRDYRRNLAAARESYNPGLRFTLYNIELEIQDPNVQTQVLDLIRTELEPYIIDDRIYSATFTVTGGSGGGTPVKDILTNVLRKAIIDGPDAAAEAFAQAVKGNSFIYYEYRVLTGIRISQEVEIFQGIKLIPLSNSVDNLPGYIPTLQTDLLVPKAEELLSKTLLRFGMEIFPTFHMPSQEYTTREQYDKSFENRRVKSEEVPDFDPRTFCHALSLETCRNIPSESGWEALDFYEIFNFGFSVGGAMGMRWVRQDLKEIGYFKVDDFDLEKVKSMYKKLMTIPKTTKDALRVPLDRWAKSNGQRDSVDSMIDLGIAFESLYLNDGGSGELKFRLAMRAAWHLGKDPNHRAELMDEFKDIYDRRSRAVHTGKLDSKSDKAMSDPKKRDAFISRAQELCSESIKTIIREGSMPDWDTIVLGSS